MEDRAVTLIAADDSTKTVTARELADSYMPCKVAEDIVLRNPEFVKIEANSELIHDCVKAHAKMLLFHAFRLHQPHVNVDLKTTASRVKHIIAGEKHQAGQLKLVPYSPTVINTAVEGNEKTPRDCRYIQIKIRLKKTFIVTFGHGSGHGNIGEKGAKKQLVVPYWLVGATGDKDRANMQHATLKCTTSIVTGTEEPADDVGSIPILQNFKAVEENEELLVLDEEYGEWTRKRAMVSHRGGGRYNTIQPSLWDRIASRQAKRTRALIGGCSKPKRMRLK